MRTSWAWAEVVVEVKHAKSKAQPFDKKFDEDPMNYLSSADKRVESRGQIVEYASELLRRQHRQFVFIISISGDDARLLYLDRSGTIVSKAFRYRQNPEIIGGFLYRIFGPNSTSVDRGHDPTAQLATSGESELFHTLHERVEFTALERAALEQAVSPGWPIYKLSITSPWSSLPCAGSTSVCHAVRPTDRTATREFLVGRPTFSSIPMVSRGTKVFIGYDLEAKVPVAIKDAWRHDRGKHGRTELQTYQEIWENPPPFSEGVPWILTPLGGGDVVGPSPIVDAEPQHTLVLKVPVPIASAERTPRIHVRLVVREVCTPLTEFKTFYDVVKAIYGALCGMWSVTCVGFESLTCTIQAHAHIWDTHGILHRDISAGNILIWYDARGEAWGKLGDWDLAVGKDDPPHVATRLWRSVSGSSCTRGSLLTEGMLRRGRGSSCLRSSRTSQTSFTSRRTTSNRACMCSVGSFSSA